MAETPASSLEAIFEDLKSDETSKKANAMKNIGTIGAALSTDRCRNELIPYLGEFLDDEEEVLVAMAEVVPTLFDLVGGKNYAYLLLEVLEKLSAIEDTSVCTASVNSYLSITQKLDCSKIEIILLEQINRMNSSEWLNSRLALCTILPSLVKDFSSDGQSMVLDTFRSLITHSNSSVRKKSADNFKHFIGKVLPRLESSLQEFLGLIGVDKDDSVRLIAVEDLLSYFKHLTPKTNSSLMPVFRMLMDDKSWRVRYLVAEKLPEFASAMAPEQRSGVLVSAMAKFLQDSEPEVRTGSCQRLVDFCKLISSDEILNSIVPLLPPLINDLEYIKATLASNIVKLMSLVTKNVASSNILPLVLELLRDNSAEIKVCVLGDLEGLFMAVGAESLSQIIMPYLNELVEDKQWRIKVKVLQSFPLLGKQLGKDFFEEHFLGMVLKMLFDSYYSVREAAIVASKDLINVFGVKWVENEIVKVMCENENSDEYSKRLTLVLMVKSIAFVLSQEFLASDIVPVLNQLSSDKVANIRLNVVKSIKEIAGVVKDQQARDSLKYCLRILNKDEDVDVRFYAEQNIRNFT
jgi:serine/threonine-protein phosphatase 2A regulatory subunit A